jgi:hypothetical protein
MTNDVFHPLASANALIARIEANLSSANPAPSKTCAYDWPAGQSNLAAIPP